MNTDPRLIEFARQMRREPAPAEKLLWKLLRHRKLAGFRFRRQHPVPPYIADFYCAVARLVVELDGESHVGDETADRTRQSVLESKGLKVVRVWNTELFDDPDTVLESVYRVCVERASIDPRFRDKVTREGQFHPSPPTPLPNGERGAQTNQPPARHSK